MASYECVVRSSYFKVKDPAEFVKWAKAADLEFRHGPNDSEDTFMVSRDGGWPDEVQDEETGEEFNFDFFSELSERLADNHVAILVEVGHEGLRYVIGQAIAIHSNGGVVDLALSDIYQMVRTKFPGAEFTYAEY